MSGPNVADRCSLVYEACGSNLTAATDTLRGCFDLPPCRLERPDRETEPQATAEADLDGRGLAVIFACGLDKVVAMLPESLPLPDWYAAADAVQTGRMETLALEWSLSLLPIEMETWEVEARPVPNLAEFAKSFGAAKTLESFDLRIDFEPPDSGDTDRLPSRVIRIACAHDPSPGTQATKSPAANLGAVVSHGLLRLVPLSVPISVRLAEKTIDVGQFIGLTPGALVTFDKNCEDPLELYVNNQLYARGEAVKIGEKFGLKIDEIGVSRQRISTIFEG